MSDSQAQVPVPEDAAVRRWQAPEMASTPTGPLTADRLADIEEQARAAGYTAGLAEGRRAGEREMQERAQQLERLLTALQPHVHVLDDQLIAQLGDLIMIIARQLVRRELHHASGEVVRVVREALVALPATDATVRVYLHPDDMPLVRQALNPERGAESLSFLEDFSMSRGGARLETDVSVVDASVERRLNEIAVKVFGEERVPTEGGEGSDERE